MGEPMTIDDVRARLGEYARGVPYGTREGRAADLRALLDDHARLAAERDAAPENTRTMVAALDDLASANAERDRLAAALAEVREAVESGGLVWPIVDEITRWLAESARPLDANGRAVVFNVIGQHLHRAALAATPAALTAAHDARVMAEGASAMRAEAARRLRNIYTRAREATVGAEAAAIVEAITSDEAIRAEAERIGGGR